MRLPDWEDRLHALVAERYDAPFVWGQNDCALWGADVVAALTGKDFGAPFRGKYADARGAAEALRDYGQGTLVKTFDHHLTRCRAAFAQRGDLVLARGSIGVLYGGEAFFVGQDETHIGLVRLARSACTLAWRV